MRKVMCIAPGIAFILFLSGCFNYDKKAEELIDYMNGYMEMEDDRPLDSLYLHALGNAEMSELVIKEDVLPILEERVAYYENAALEYKEIQHLNELIMGLENYVIGLYEEYNLTDLLL